MSDRTICILEIRLPFKGDSYTKINALLYLNMPHGAMINVFKTKHFRLINYISGSIILF